jgi:hypothetical protein
MLLVWLRFLFGEVQLFFCGCLWVVGVTISSGSVDDSKYHLQLPP